MERKRTDSRGIITIHELRFEKKERRSSACAQKKRGKKERKKGTKKSGSSRKSTQIKETKYSNINTRKHN